MLCVQVSVPRCCAKFEVQSSTFNDVISLLRFEMQHISNYECYEMVDLQYEISKIVWCFSWHFSVCFEGIRCRTTSNRWTKDTQERSIDQRTSSDSIWFFQRREWLNVIHSIQRLWILDYKLTMSYLMLKACCIEEISARDYAPESSLAICSDFCCENRAQCQW